MNPENLLKERFKHYEIKHTKKKTKKTPTVLSLQMERAGARGPRAPPSARPCSATLWYTANYTTTCDT